MSGQDYARLIGEEYHKLVDGKTKEEIYFNLKEARDWAESRKANIDDDPSLTSITARVKSISDQYTNLVRAAVNASECHRLTFIISPRQSRTCMTFPSLVP